MNPSCGSHARERLGRVVQDRDLVLVAVLVAGLDPHDVGNGLALVRGRRGDVGRWVVRVVVGERATGRLVAVLVAHGLVALRVGRRGLADPGLYLRSGEHRAAVRVVGDRDARVTRPLRTRGKHVVAERQAGDEAFEAPVRANGEGTRHVAAVIEHADLGRSDAGGNLDRHERITGGDDLRPVREHLDAQARGCGTGGRHTPEHQLQPTTATSTSDAFDSSPFGLERRYPARSSF